MIPQVEQITLSSSSAVNYDTLSWEELEAESRHNPNAKYLAVKAMLNREYHDRLCNMCVEDFSRAPWLIRSDGMCRGSHCPFGRPDNHPTIAEYERAFHDLCKEDSALESDERINTCCDGDISKRPPVPLRQEKVALVAHAYRKQEAIGCNLHVEDFSDYRIKTLSSGRCCKVNCPFGAPQEHPTTEEYAEARRQEFGE